MFVILLLISHLSDLIHITVFFAQNTRFSIVEDFGCVGTISDTWVALVIVSIPPVVLEFIAGIYGCLSLHAFHKRRSQLNENISSHRNLNSRRYIRLMCFSLADLLVGMPVAVFYLYFQARELHPFPGLTKEHYDLSQIVQIPAVYWRTNVLVHLTCELNRWVMVWGAFVFFAIFGFTKESRNNYRAVLQSAVQFLRTITGIKGGPSSEAVETEGCVTSSFILL